MAGSWHLDVPPGVDGVLEEVGAHYLVAVAVCQDLAVFNITADAVLVRQSQVNDAPRPVHGPSTTQPAMAPAPAAPGWWAEAGLDI